MRQLYHLTSMLANRAARLDAVQLRQELFSVSVKKNR